MGSSGKRSKLGFLIGFYLKAYLKGSSTGTSQRVLMGNLVGSYGVFLRGFKSRIQAFIQPKNPLREYFFPPKRLFGKHLLTNKPKESIDIKISGFLLDDGEIKLVQT